MQMQSKLCKRDGAGAGEGDGDDGGSGGLSLPEDIILDVLFRLPTKALRQCRCVCKAWHALISDPAFFAARRSRGRAGPLIVTVFGSAPELELRLLDDVGNVHRVFDVRGPAWLAPTCLDVIFVKTARLGALIIDPVSGHDFTVIGTNDPSLPPWRTSTAVSTTDYSFGRDAASGDYKVLRLVTSSGDYSFYCSRWCEVATIMDGGAEPTTWRQRPWGPFSKTIFSYQHKATVNGNLYFMLCDTYSASHGRNCIASFDLDREEWKPEKIKGPLWRHRNKDDKWHITLTELKGSLCMVHNVQYLADLVGHYADICLLKDPNRSVWVKKCKIQMPERLLLFTMPLDVLFDGTLLLVNTFRKAESNDDCHQYCILRFYNSRTKAFTDFIEMAEGFNGRMAFYTGSLYLDK